MNYANLNRIFSDLDGEGGNDEAAKGAVVLIGSRADEFGVSAGSVAVDQLAVLVITILPESESFGISHLGLAL